MNLVEYRFGVHEKNVTCEILASLGKSNCKENSARGVCAEILADGIFNARCEKARPPHRLMRN